MEFIRGRLYFLIEFCKWSFLTRIMCKNVSNYKRTWETPTLLYFCAKIQITEFSKIPRNKEGSRIKAQRVSDPTVGFYCHNKMAIWVQKCTLAVRQCFKSRHSIAVIVHHPELSHSNAGSFRPLTKNRKGYFGSILISRSSTQYYFQEKKDTFWMIFPIFVCSEEAILKEKYSHELTGTRPSLV